YIYTTSLHDALPILGINSTKMGDIKTDGYNFAPAVGYFLTENIALEGGIAINKQTISMDFEGEAMDVEAKGFAVAVAGKYYFTPDRKSTRLNSSHVK